MSREPVDKGNRVAVQRALDAFNRARGSMFIDRQTAYMYLLEALQRDWDRIADRDRNPEFPDDVPTFEQLARAAARMAKQ